MELTLELIFVATSLKKEISAYKTKSLFPKKDGYQHSGQQNLEDILYEMKMFLINTSEVKDTIVTITGVMEHQKKVVAIGLYFLPPECNMFDIEKIFVSSLAA